MITRVLQLRYPMNSASLGPMLWELLGNWIDGGPAKCVPRPTGRCEAIERSRVAS